MTSLFGRIHIGRLPTEQERHERLLKKLQRIMATQAEIAAQLKGATDKIVALTAQITKIGTETQALKDKIADLENSLPDNASAELTDAVEALKLQLGSLESATQVVDDKVPDVPTP